MDIFVLLILLLCIKELRFVRPLTGFHSGYSSIASFSFLRGFFALVVTLHHIAQFTEGGYLFHYFSYVGDLAVAVFFFITGYGLIRKYLTDEHYLEGFIKKRFITLIIPYLVFLLIYGIVDSLNGTIHSVGDLFRTLAFGTSAAGASWYVVVVCGVYAVFYLSAKFLGNASHVIIIEGFCCVIWLLLCKLLGLGSYWYTTLPAVMAGFLWAEKEERINEILRQSRPFAAIVILGTVLFAAAFCCSLLDVPLAGPFCAFAGPVLFALLVMCLWTRIIPARGIVTFLGSISLELYLIHGVFLLNLPSENELLYAVLTIALSIISAFMLNRLFRLISKRLLSK